VDAGDTAGAGAAVLAGALGRAIKGPAAGDGAVESCDPWGPPVPTPELPETPPAGAVLVLVSVGAGDTVGEGELDGGSVVDDVVGEAGGVDGCEDVLGVAGGEALDGDGDVVGSVAAGDDVGDGLGEGHADDAGDGPL
jgi:hypothetical protein